VTGSTLSAKASATLPAGSIEIVFK
jgi:hypothetical protein